MSGNSPTEAVAAKKGSAPRSAKSKAPARPHRRLPGETLNIRLKDLIKKKAITESRLVLLVDRLEMLQKEQQMREDEAAADK